MEKDFIDALELFNEKAERLINSRFLTHLKEKGMNVNLNVDAAGGSVKTNLPDQESIEAFVLNIRYFIQDNEISSLRNLAQQYNQANISATLKQEFDFARNKLNSELQKSSNIKIDGDLTNGEILRTFIYGGIAHANPDKKKIYDTWIQNKYAGKFIEMHFCNVLFYTLEVIANIRSTNQRTLEELKGKDK